MSCKHCKLPIYFFIILILVAPSVFSYTDFVITDYGLEYVSLSWAATENVTIMFTDDNITYNRVEFFDDINNVATQRALTYDTDYYFRINNGTNTTTLNQKTKDIFESLETRRSSRNKDQRKSRGQTRKTKNQIVVSRELKTTLTPGA